MLNWLTIRAFLYHPTIVRFEIILNTTNGEYETY